MKLKLLQVGLLTTFLFSIITSPLSAADYRRYKSEDDFFRAMGWTGKKNYHYHLEWYKKKWKKRYTSDRDQVGIDYKRKTKWVYDGPDEYEITGGEG